MKSIEIIKNNKKRKILLLDDREKLLNSDNEAEKYAYKIFALGEPYEDVVEELIEEHKYSVIEEINLLRDKYDGEDVLTN